MMKKFVCAGLSTLSLALVSCSNPPSQQLTFLTLSATPTTLNIGATAMLKATAHLSDGTTQDVTTSTTFTLSAPNLGSISSNVLTAEAAGTATVAGAYVQAVSTQSTSGASPTPLNATAQITITAPPPGVATPTISWNTPAAITYGAALSGTQLNATSSVDGTFTYTPAAGTLLKAGAQTLTVAFTPSDPKSYTGASASVQLSVMQATPVISWPTPAAISVGTALSAAQLDATASVAGTFAYNPAMGNVPAAGVQTLTAVFTPTDATDYSSATAHTSLTVNAGSTPTPPPTQPNPPTPTPPPGLPTPIGCGGGTVNVNSGMSQSVLQSTIATAPACSLILFAPGTYNITKTLQIPCASKITLSGAGVVPATATLAAASGVGVIFRLDNCTGVTIEFLHFQNTQAIYMGDENNAGLTIRYNQITNLTETAGIAIDGHLAAAVTNGVVNNVVSDTVIEHNTIGDAASCTADLATSDYYGYCAGITTHAGEMLRLTIDYNEIYHMSEGIHLLQIANYNPNATNGVCVTCEIDYNYIHAYHRIGFENQLSAPSDPIHVEHNIIEEPVNGYWGSMAMSMACCISGFIQGGYSGNNPSLYYNDNVTINSGSGGGIHVPYAIEFWGTGAQGLNSLIEGSFANGYVYGYGSGWTIKNNIICGKDMASAHSYYDNEEGVTPPPVEIGNTTGATCSTTPSTAPTISPSSGNASFPLTVTLADTGANTSIYYTTDGSTPVPGSGTTTLYTGSFQLTNAATVKAVGMWGVAPQPLSFPAGYGYVPSSVVTAAFTSGGSIARPATSARAEGVSSATAEASCALELQTTAAARVDIGKTLQMKALASSSEGYGQDVTTRVAWASSDLRTAFVDASGAVSGLASGEAVISASWNGCIRTVTVRSTVGAVSWNSPIVITKGGTYTGNWRSTDAGIPAVSVTTTEPVLIESAHLSGAGDLIKVTASGADVTVTNSTGVAFASSRKGDSNGVFLDAGTPKRLVVKNNYVENVRVGVMVRGLTGSGTLKISGNRVRNINGLVSDGAGAYQPGSNASLQTAHFIQLEGVHAVPGVDIGWNEVINYPLESAGGDVIDLYQSSGTQNQPLEIHDSYLQGAYSAGGIHVHGEANDAVENSAAFAWVHDNQVVGTVAYGIAFMGGHDNVAAANRIISSGLLPDGTRIAGQQAGLISSYADGGATAGSYNNSMRDNIVGWACWSEPCRTRGNRWDEELPASTADYGANAGVASSKLTLQQEESEYLMWVSKHRAEGVVLGPTF